METLKDLENKFDRWFKVLPGLPNSARKFLADYLWIMVIISSILYGVFLLMVLGLATFIIPAFSFISIQTIDAGISYSTIVSMLELILVLSLMVSAIGPLRKHQRSGWDKMFLVALVGFVAAIIQLFFSFSLYNLVSAFVWLAIEMYLLMQTKSFFIKKA